MQPAFGVGFAILLLGESLTAGEVLGGILILGAVIVERARRALPEPAPAD
jgi:drug/metabolite transporter (DMT)-like permease